MRTIWPAEPKIPKSRIEQEKNILLEATISNFLQGGIPYHGSTYVTSSRSSAAFLRSRLISKHTLW